MSTATLAAPRRRTLLLLLGALFLLPLGLAFLLYYGFDWRPSGQTNHGSLIRPARPLPPLLLPQFIATQSAPGAQEVMSAPTVLQGKWSLLYIGDGDCDAACRQALYFMRQTYLGLGNQTSRLQRVFLVTAHCCDANYLAREQPGLIVLRADAPQAAPLLAQFPDDQRAATLFIIDPLGNLMMRYDTHDRPRGLHDDMKQLLGLSHIG
ncbi:MAG TPA: hypothetical protein VGF89_11755 [Steroidobacteraceae bacterium]